MIDLDGLVSLQRRCDRVFVDRSVAQYAVDLVQATRHPADTTSPTSPPSIALGVSPRATLAWCAAPGRWPSSVGAPTRRPQDVFDIAPEVLRHRLLLTYDALARDITIDDVVNRVLSTVPATWVSPKPNEAAQRADR